MSRRKILRAGGHGAGPLTAAAALVCASLAALVSACNAPDPGSPASDPSDVAASGNPTGGVTSGGNRGGAGSDAGGGVDGTPDAATTPTSDGSGPGADAGAHADTGAPSADGGTPPPASGAAQDCVDAINTYRATLGLAPYARWTKEETCADGQALSDSKSGKAHGAFTQCGEFAQDECPGWPGPDDAMIPKCLAAMWAEGPGGGHYENMRGKYTQVACGFTTLADGSVWAVQDFK